MQDPRVNIAGIRRADLLTLLEQLLPPARLSRQLRRLRDIGVIKRVAGTYRYYLASDAVHGSALPPDPEHSHSGTDLMGFFDA